MAEIVFDKHFPNELKTSVENVLVDFEWLLPTWTQRLYVGWDASDADNSASMRVDRDYRFCRLTICPHLFSSSGDILREDIIHELIHTFISPIKNYACDIVDKICYGNDVLNNVIKAELVSRNEQVTQDFAYAIAKKFRETK